VNTERTDHAIYVQDNSLHWRKVFNASDYYRQGRYPTPSELLHAALISFALSILVFSWWARVI
jgi:hypothetical protein